MEELVYRRPRRPNQFGTYPLAAGGALVLQIPSTLYQLVVTAVVVPAALAVARVRSTTVTAEGITIRTLRSRFIPWAHVDAITVLGADGGGRGNRGDQGARALEIRLSDGSRHRLPAPTEHRRRPADPPFDDAYRAIVAAWLRSAAPLDADAQIRPGG